MSFTEFDHAYAEVKMDAYIEEKRPPEHIRPKLDIGYRIENQSIFIFEIRPHFQTGKIMNLDVAKTTYVKSEKTWKVYWMRQDLKWHRYEPAPSVDKLEDWIKTIEEDEHCCFWG